MVVICFNGLNTHTFVYRKLNMFWKVWIGADSSHSQILVFCSGQLNCFTFPSNSLQTHSVLKEEVMRKVTVLTNENQAYGVIESEATTASSMSVHHDLIMLISNAF